MQHYLKLFLILFLFFSCAKENDTPEFGAAENLVYNMVEGLETLEVTPGGGDLIFSNGVSISLPENAVVETTKIQLGTLRADVCNRLIEVSPRTHPKSFSKGIIFPEGEIQFQDSVRVTFQLSNDFSANSLPVFVNVYPQSDLYYYKPQKLFFNQVTGELSFKTKSLSSFGIMEMKDFPNLKSAGSNCKEGLISVEYEFTDIQHGECASAREKIKVEYLDCPPGTVYEHDILEQSAACDDKVAPSLVATFPKNNAEEVNVETNIVLQFSEPVLGEVAINSLKFTPELKGSYTYNPEATRIIFHPSEDLDYNTTYEVTIDHKKFIDRVGNYLDKPYKLTFTTEKEKWKGKLSVSSYCGYLGLDEDDFICDAKLEIDFDFRMEYDSYFDGYFGEGTGSARQDFQVLSQDQLCEVTSLYNPTAFDITVELMLEEGNLWISFERTDKDYFYTSVLTGLYPDGERGVPMNYKRKYISIESDQNIKLEQGTQYGLMTYGAFADDGYNNYDSFTIVLEKP